MKQLFLFGLPLLLCMATTVNTSAQDPDFETWRRQKSEAYDKWKKMRAEIVGHLPTNPAMDAVSSFIDQGFATQPASPVQPANPVQPVKPEQPTNVAPAPDTPPSAVAPQSVAPDIKIWVVIVGVASYSGINSLNYTDDDAYKMYAFYKSPEGGSLPDTQIEVLIDEDATRKNIMTALDNIYSKATEKDVIIFYFSGHGSKEAFVTHEYDGERDSNGDYKGFLLHNELHNIFDKSPAKYKYIIADACHSGSSANKGPTGSGNATYYRAFEQAKGGFVMLLSSMGDEVSVETRGVRQGVFSHFLIRGLKGEADTNKDRMISVIELFEYVEPNVKRYTNNKQNPILFGDFNDVLPISVIK